MDKDERIRELEVALEFYSDPADYKAPLTGGMGKLWRDCGTVARLALREGLPGDADRVDVSMFTPYKL